jgi:hypothetical protein
MTPDHADHDDEDAADRSLDVRRMSDDEAEEGYDQVEGDIQRVNDSLNPRLSRISVCLGPFAETDNPDRIRYIPQDIARQASGFAKAQHGVGQEVEGSREATCCPRVSFQQRASLTSSSENERLVEDLQEKLEETRAEIAQRRKDEKELKSKDRAQLIQISGVSLETSRCADVSSRGIYKASNEAWRMRKRITPTCRACTMDSVVRQTGRMMLTTDETQRLRDLLKERDEEIERLEDASVAHEGEESKVSGSTWHKLMKVRSRSRSARKPSQAT